MSSGIEADIALDAAVIASLGLTRVLGGAAGLAGAGAGALATYAEARAEGQAEKLLEAERYERAIGDVLDRNARLAALAESRQRHDLPGITLPDPLELTGQPLNELDAWCEHIDAALADAEEGLSAAIAAGMARRIFATAPEALKAPRGGDDTKVASASPATADTVGTLTRVLTRLLPDAADDDRRAVTEAAEQVASATTPGEAESRLTEVRIRIQKANRRTRDRRDDVAAATRFLCELDGEAAAETTRADLADVIKGGRSFDAKLRAEAVRVTENAQERAAHRYVADAIRQAFGELGYEVSEGFETLTAHDGEAVLTRGDWPQHAVKIRVDDARQVRMALLRTEQAVSDDQRRLDVEREQQWCASFEAARERLAEAGINADVRWRIEPGEQRIPVVPTRRSRQRPAPRRRERDR